MWLDRVCALVPKAKKAALKKLLAEKETYDRICLHQNSVLEKVADFMATTLVDKEELEQECVTLRGLADIEAEAKREAYRRNGELETAAAAAAAVLETSQRAERDLRREMEAVADRLRTSESDNDYCTARIRDLQANLDRETEKAAQLEAQAASLSIRQKKIPSGGYCEEIRMLKQDLAELTAKVDAEMSRAREEARNALATAQTQISDKLKDREARLSQLTLDREDSIGVQERLREENCNLAAAVEELKKRCEWRADSEGPQCPDLTDEHRDSLLGEHSGGKKEETPWAKKRPSPPDSARDAQALKRKSRLPDSSVLLRQEAESLKQLNSTLRSSQEKFQSMLNQTARDLIQKDVELKAVKDALSANETAVKRNAALNARMVADVNEMVSHASYLPIVTSRSFAAAVLNEFLVLSRIDGTANYELHVRQYCTDGAPNGSFRLLCTSAAHTVGSEWYAEHFYKPVRNLAVTQKDTENFIFYRLVVCRSAGIFAKLLQTVGAMSAASSRRAIGHASSKIMLQNTLNRQMRMYSEEFCTVWLPVYRNYLASRSAHIQPPNINGKAFAKAHQRAASHLSAVATRRFDRQDEAAEAAEINGLLYTFVNSG